MNTSAGTPNKAPHAPPEANVDNKNALLLSLVGAFGITSIISMFNGKNDVFSAGFGLLCFNFVVTYMRDFFRWFWNYLYDKMTYSITVKSNDECFNYLLEWFAEQKFMTNSHSMTVTTSRNGEDSDDEGDSDRSPTVRFLPSGHHTVWYKGKLVTFSRAKDEEAPSFEFKSTKKFNEILTVTMYDSRKNLLVELVQAAVALSVKKRHSKVGIHIYEFDYWTRSVVKEKRDIESVFLERDVKNALESDVKFFLNNKDWYLRRGIPYRRGYLLYGPPGTGKTSSIFAMAGKYNLAVSILNLNSPAMDDNKLISAIAEQPKNTVLVMEDIDSLFVKRESTDSSSHISFAGLLNALDGIATVDGRILFMTTNHIDKLSPALIRPGRIDRKFLYDYASHEQVKAMFSQFYEECARPDVLDVILDKLGDKKITTAQLQGWFILYCTDPGELLADVDRFIEQSVKDNSRTDDAAATASTAPDTTATTNNTVASSSTANTSSTAIASVSPPTTDEKSVGTGDSA